ncbi:6901_t:CDS:2, partial [Gigaspora margarita]
PNEIMLVLEYADDGTYVIIWNKKLTRLTGKKRICLAKQLVIRKILHENNNSHESDLNTLDSSNDMMENNDSQIPDDRGKLVAALYRLIQRKDE